MNEFIYDCFTPEESKEIEESIEFHANKFGKVKGSTFDKDDLIQEGRIIAIKALRNYCPGKGRISTYLNLFLHHGLTDFVQRETHAFSFSEDDRKKISSIHKYRKDYMSQNGEEPNAEELAVLTGLDADRINELLSGDQAASNLTSLDSPLGDDPARIIDYIPDVRRRFEDEVLTRISEEQLTRLINEELNPVEAMVIKLYVGLTGGREHSCEEIRKIVGLGSRQRANQILHDAENKLRRALRDPLAA